MINWMDITCILLHILKWEIYIFFPVIVCTIPDGYAYQATGYFSGIYCLVSVPRSTKQDGNICALVFFQVLTEEKRCWRKFHKSGPKWRSMPQHWETCRQWLMKKIRASRNVFKCKKTGCAGHKEKTVHFG